MRIKKLDGNQERQILVGFIISKHLLTRIVPLYNSRYFQSEYVRTIANWCVSFFKKYDDAPKTQIKRIYQMERDKGHIDEEYIDHIRRLLLLASQEFETIDKYNHEFAIEETVYYFRKRATQLTIETATDFVENDEIDEAEAALSNHNRISLGNEHTLDFQNQKEVKDRLEIVYEEQEKPLFQFPGAIGRMLNHDILRGSFMGFLGREKIGKTWLLGEFAVRALRQKNNVMFFQAGDMSTNQQLLRLAIRVAGRSNKPFFCGKVMVPVLDCIYNQLDTCNLKKRVNDCGLEDVFEDFGRIAEKLIKQKKPASKKRQIIQEFLVNKGGAIFKTILKNEGQYTPCSICSRDNIMTFEGIPYFEQQEISVLYEAAAQHALNTLRSLSGRKNLVISSYSNGTLTSSMMRAEMERQHNENGFTPDLLIIDYPDIMEADDKRVDGRHQENAKWKGIRRLTQDFNCFCVTVTQADAKAYKKATLDLNNFSEDKRKYAHVTSMFGMNQTYQERMLGILRINPMLFREHDVPSNHHVNILQKISMGRPLLSSYDVWM
jgi:hypothetical protein